MFVYTLYSSTCSLNADNHSAEDFPQSADFATVSTASDSSFSLASHWLCDCLTNHRSCNYTADASFVPPTRVIDVGFRDGKRLPRLYLSSSEDLNMKYIALSHCWGETKAPILKKHMLRTMTLGLDWHRLPKTFQEAILVTRRLGFRYLWIDSLCIIQDSPEDWLKESGTMQNVYANCVLTIVASWGKDSSTGLFIERKPLNQQPCRIIGNACTGVYVQPNPTAVRKDGVGSGHVESLEKRAWAVQERFLPPRTLSYRSFELKWDCLESRGSESWPTGLRTLASRLMVQSRSLYKPVNTAFRELSLLKARSNRFDLEFIDEFYPHWDNILIKYTRAKLTFPSDIFVAISGLIKNIETWTGLTNIYGLWKELLPIDLLWARDEEDSQATRSLLCPTWSWGSLIGTQVSIRKFVYYVATAGHLGPEGKYPVLIKARVISLDPASAVSESSTRIKIQGPMFCTKILGSNRDSFPRFSFEQSEVSSVVLDSPGKHMDNVSVFCLLVFEREDPSHRKLGLVRTGLILARAESENEEYIRLGVWQHIVRRVNTTEREEYDLISDAEEKTVFLI